MGLIQMVKERFDPYSLSTQQWPFRTHWFSHPSYSEVILSWK